MTKKTLQKNIALLLIPVLLLRLMSIPSISSFVIFRPRNSNILYRKRYERLRHFNERMRLFWYTATKNGTKWERERIFWYQCYLESASLSPFIVQHIHNMCNADTSCAHNVNQNYIQYAECCTLRNCPVEHTVRVSSEMNECDWKKGKKQQQKN